MIRKKKSSVSQIILVDLKKIEKVLHSLNTEHFKKDIYSGFFTSENYTDYKNEKTVNLNQLKKLVSIFGEKKFPLCRSNLQKALIQLFTSNKYKNGTRVKDKLLKSFTMESSDFTLGEFNILSGYENFNFFGWLTKEEIEENFMKILEELADIHEKFNLEKTGISNPELTVSLLEYIEGGDWKYQETREFADQFEEIIKNFFCAFRRAHQNCLDLVIMEEEPW